MSVVPLFCICLLLYGRTRVSCQKFSWFREELFPEQLEQQQLQLKQGAVQEQLQQLQRQIQVNQENAVIFESLIARQNALFQELNDIQKQLLELQQKLQNELGGGIRFQITNVTSPAPDFANFVARNENVQTIKPVTDNSLPPFDGAHDVLTVRESESPPAHRDAAIPVFDELDSPCTSSLGDAGFCKPLVKCLAFYADIPELRKRPCQLRVGEFGVCCPFREKESPAGFARTGVISPPPPPPVVVPTFTTQEIDRSITAALERIENRKTLVSDLFTQRILVPTNTAAAGHQKLFPTSNETLEIGEGAQKNVEASVELVNDFKLSPEQGTFALPKFSILNTVLADTCPKKAFCRPHKYRATDGSCNNLNNQRWGTPGTALQRILPPKYGDGVNSPRTHANNGALLPSARVVSVNFAEARDSPSVNLTLLLMQWGQFVDHDLTHTPISRGQSGFGISCCRNGKVIEASLRHPDCFAIEIPNNDHMFSRFGEQCMEFVRSLPAPRPECNFGPREQVFYTHSVSLERLLPSEHYSLSIDPEPKAGSVTYTYIGIYQSESVGGIEIPDYEMNQITGYQDGSSIYAASLDVQRGLRQFQGGRFRAQNIDGKELLPANPRECSDPQQTRSCFSAGDGRVNEQLELALVHTIWLREHNGIADTLASMHPNWSDEAIFQETRRIVIAEIQHITYNEFLPLILGDRYVDSFQLRPRNSGWTQLYDVNLNPGITNVFATAAYRFGHTLIQSNLLAYGKFGNIRENLQLSKQHFAPFSLYRTSAIDDFIRGITFQTCQNFDRFFSNEITDHLFQGNLNFGLDLVALNLQRGRDHGLPPYNDWREVCGMRRAKTWKDLEDTMDPENIERLARLYNNVEEVDLFVAGVAERSLRGALLGPTFVCLVGDQFSRLRRGDRFFYEEAKQPSSFSEAQLNEIRKVSLARVLCDNSDKLTLIQPLVFLTPSFLNERVPCDSPAIPKMNLRAWLNENPAVP